MEFKIEKGIAPPVEDRRYNKFPFKDMAVGDSFELPDMAVGNSARFAASYYGKRNGKKFSVHKNGTGYRCWRIA